MIKIAQDSVEIVPSIKNVLKFYENYKKFSTIYIISPVNVSNINEKADLTRFLNTLRLIPKMQWIVVENTPEKSEKIKKFLQKSGVNYVHLNRYVKENQVLDKKVSLEQFDEGLNWLRSNYHNIHQDGVVYLAKIQTSYETRIFELMRNTKKVMVWPIGMVNKSLYSRPVCIGQKVIFFKKIRFRECQAFKLSHVSIYVLKSTNLNILIRQNIRWVKKNFPILKFLALIFLYV